MTSQHVRVALGDKDVAEVTAEYEVLVQGEPKGPVVLPVTGVPREAAVSPSGAALSASAGKAGEWLLVAPAPGRYAVRSRGRCRCRPAASAVSPWPRPRRRSR